LAIAAAALYYAVAQVDTAEMWRQLSGGNYALLPVFFGLLAAYYLVTGFNWILLLRPMGTYSLRQVFPAMMIGFGGNNLLPAHLGELVRTVAFARQYQRSTGGVLASLVLERVLDVAAILVYYFLSVQVTGALPESIRTGAEWVALSMVPFCLALFAFLRFPRPFMALWDWGSAWMPGIWRRKGTSLLNGIVAGLSAMDSPGHVLAMAALSMIKWALTGAMVWVALQAFGITIPFNAAMIVVAVSALAVALPNAPGYVGTLQAAFVFSLTPFGVSPEVAFASSVYYLVAQWVPVTVAGIVSFFLVGLHLRDLRQDLARVEQEPPA
jgi:uncharacterized protein (TIRG00374 family)